MTSLSTLARDVAAMSQKIAPQMAEHAIRTPLAHFAAASEASRSTLLVKCQHQQRTGSFKLRGALSKVLSRSDEDRSCGIVTASTGNHGLGVAQAVKSLGGRREHLDVDAASRPGLCHGLIVTRDL